MGMEENLKGYEAAAGLLPPLMLRGTKQLSYQQLRDELDRLSATLSTGGGGGRGGQGRGGPPVAGEAGALSFQSTPRETLFLQCSRSRQVLREPALPADQFELIKREWLASIEQSRTEPDTLASRHLRRQLAPYSKDDIRTCRRSRNRSIASRLFPTIRSYNSTTNTSARRRGN